MFSAFCIAAPNSGEGKTTLSMGLMRLLSQSRRVQPFKCGPDYIDTSYHKIACRHASYNLDSWLMGEKEVKKTFFTHTADCEIAIVEGVMGLFDGKKQEYEQGRLPAIFGSTAHIAQILDLPIILVIDCRGMAQSVSAIVRGFQAQCGDYGLKLAGILANNVGSEKHFAMLKESLEAWNLPPLLGFIPKNLGISFKERQLGLPHLFEQTEELDNKLDELADILKKHIDVDRLLGLTACKKHSTEFVRTALPKPKTKRLALAYDKAFCFYYRQNLETLEKLGYDLIPFSPLKDAKLPKADALYLGGGYPEIYAKELSENVSMRSAIKDFAANDGNIFAECGGFMYLCSSLKTVEAAPQTDLRTAEQAKAQNYPLCGVLDAEAVMGTRLRSLGYREGKFLQAPFFWESENNMFRGHEFHWSDIILHKEYAPFLEIDGKALGVTCNNVYASYIHFYFAQLI